jgi:hypothetical protein
MAKPRPGKPHVRNGEQKRARIATEAARIMAEEGVRDFQMAKRKALARLDITERHNLPTNQEIDDALAERLQLFHATQVAENARRLREIATEAIRFLSAYEPKLVGSVLSGKVTDSSPIQLHVTADSPEDIGRFLQEHGVPFELGERRFRFGGERYKNVSTYRFTADGVAIELSVFNPRAARESPLSPIDGRPMQRASLRDVEALL